MIISRIISVMEGWAALAASCTSSWLTSTGLSKPPKSVMTEMPKVWIPQWWATITRYGRHADGISTHHVIHPIFCRSLEGWSLDTDIHTIGDTYLLLESDISSELDQFLVVGLMHIREAGTGGVVLAT